jgi:hypothetical protein
MDEELSDDSRDRFFDPAADDRTDGVAISTGFSSTTGDGLLVIIRDPRTARDNSLLTIFSNSKTPQYSGNSKHRIFVRSEAMGSEPGALNSIPEKSVGLFRIFLRIERIRVLKRFLSAI